MLFEWKWFKTCNGKRLVSISEHLELSAFDPLVCPGCFRVTILLFRMTLERVTSCQRLNATSLCVILGRLNQQGNKHSFKILEEQKSREIWISRAHIKNPFKPHKLDDKISVKKSLWICGTKSHESVDGGALESEIDVFQGKDTGMALESALSISFEFSLVVLIDLNGSDSWNAVFEVKSSRRNEIPYIGSKSVTIPNQGDDFNSWDLIGKSWMLQIASKPSKMDRIQRF